MKSYIFRVELTQDEDGRWNAVVPSLRACYTWGNTEEEALVHMQDAVRCCLEDMMAHDEPLPPDVEVIDGPVASVTLCAAGSATSGPDRSSPPWRGMAFAEPIRPAAMLPIAAVLAK